MLIAEDRYKWHISMALLQKYRRDAVAMDAISLSLLVKTRFVSSAIPNYSPFKLRQHFGIGDARARKLVAKCKEMGIAKMSGRTLVFTALRKVGINTFFTLTIPQRRSEELQEKINIKYIKDFLYGELVKNVIKTKQNVTDTIDKINHGKYADRPIFRYVSNCMREGKCKDKIETITYNYIAKSVGLGRSKTIAIVKDLIKRQQIGKYSHKYLTDYDSSTDAKLLNNFVEYRKDLSRDEFRAIGVYINTREGVVINSGNTYCVGDKHIHCIYNKPPKFKKTDAK